MFGRKDETTTQRVYDTHIGKNSVFEGNILSEGTVGIDGKIKGDLRITGDLYIGESAIITGNITAGNVDLSGTVEGNITARGVLRILSTARLYGDMQVHSFMAEEGGIFQGRCSMMDTSEAESTSGKNSARKSHSSKDYRKSSIIDQSFDEPDKDSGTRAG